MTNETGLRTQPDVADTQASSQSRQGQAGSTVVVSERPALAPNVQLIGEMQDTAYTSRQWLIRRGGQFVQVSELFYRVAEQCNGERTLEEIAAGVTESTEWMVAADQVRQLIQTKLIPLGFIAAADNDASSPGDVPEDSGPRSPLAMNMRMKVIGAHIVEPIARILQVLYAPPVLVAVLILAVLAHLWLYGVHGMSGAISEILYRPWLLLVIVGIMAVAGIFHEFGHAAALRYGGGKVGGMGVGLYLFYPAFYTDVTDSYRLGRWARVRTDAGGFYFYLIFSLGIMALYWITGQEFLLATVVLINLDIMYQLLPFVRFDGYWILADLTGIPDPFSLMAPFVGSLLPIQRYKGLRLPQLKQWVKVVYIAYIVLTIPVLALLYLLLLRRLPRFLAASWDAFLSQLRTFSVVQNEGYFLGMAVLAMNMLLIALIVLGLLYVFFNASRMLIRGIWNWSATSPKRRAVGSAIMLAGLALVAFLWAPQLIVAGQSVPVGVESFAVATASHVQERVDYAQTPPVGGDHAQIWQNCGFYDMPIENENGVHSLEHGAVWITYRPDLPGEQVDVLRQRARRQSHVLVSPFPNLPAPVVVSAWGRQLRLDTADDPRLDQFVRAFRLGQQAPEAGEPCSGGKGNPR